MLLFLVMLHNNYIAESSHSKNEMSSPCESLAASDGLLDSDIEENDSTSSAEDSDINNTQSDDEYQDDDPGIGTVPSVSLPLYDNAEISVFESHLLCFQFAIRHSLTAKAFSELLQLLSVHLPSSSMAPKSIYQLKSFFLNLFPHASPTVHSYCAFCLSLCGDEGFCSTERCEGGSKEEFISIALTPQLKRIIEGKI